MPLHLPPSGVGVYARSQALSWLAQWDFVCLNATQVGHSDMARALIAAGKRVWLYSTPERWAPGVWQVTLPDHVAQAKALGCEGVIADAERAMSQAEAAQLGAALAVAAGEVRVGFTSFPSWGPLASLAAACGGKVWGSPQLYYNVSVAAQAHWWQRWAAVFGASMLVPSVAAYYLENPGADEGPQFTPENFGPYLATIPSAVGNIAWTTGSEPAFMFAALRSRHPAPLPVRLALEVRGYATTIYGMIAIAIIVMAAILATVMLAR